jgi:hypothetical protein
MLVLYITESNSNRSTANGTWGMNDRVRNGITREAELAIQSNASPASAPRTKILNTIQQLTNYVPTMLACCTAAFIGAVQGEPERNAVAALSGDL